MSAIKVTYDRDAFIKLSDVGKKLAEQYCNENPKEQYDCEDFIQLYHMKRQIECTGGPVGHGYWNETSSDFDRIINAYESTRNRD